MLQEEQLIGYRVSPQQRRVWGLLEGAPASLRALCAVRIEGAFEPDELRRTLRRVLGRHEILRTVFQLPAGIRVPVQVITEASAGEGAGAHIEVTGATTGSASEMLERVFDERTWRPFDVKEGPLVRTVLTPLSSDEALWVLDVSALCADAPSLHQLIGEVADACCARRPATESGEEPMQYADFAEWQNELLESTDTREGLEYWSTREQPPTLSGEETGAPGAAFTPRRRLVPWPAELGDLLRSRADALNVPVTALLAASFQALWSRLDPETSEPIGVLSGNRKYAGLETLVGAVGRVLPLAPGEAPREASLRDLAELQSDLLAQNRGVGGVLPGAGERLLPSLFFVRGASGGLVGWGLAFRAVGRAGVLRPVRREAELRSARGCVVVGVALGRGALRGGRDRSLGRAVGAPAGRRSSAS